MYLSLWCEYTRYVIDLNVAHSLETLAPKYWASLDFGHHISNLVAGVLVAEVDRVFLAPISDHVMLYINVFGSFCSHVVGGHVQHALLSSLKRTGSCS